MRRGGALASAVAAAARASAAALATVLAILAGTAGQASAAGVGATASPPAATARSTGAAAPVPGTPGATAKATFAGGCFWCVESDFDKLPGVVATTSGYIGGTVARPSYEQVASGRTGHFEAVQVEYDPARVSYAQLVEYFWRHIDPTDPDGQFCDKGTPYRTAIFAHDDAQLAAAQASKAALDRTKPFGDPVVTEVRRAATFYPAEDYHQDYYRKNPLRYAYYRAACGRDARVQQLWGRGRAPQ